VLSARFDTEADDVCPKNVVEGQTAERDEAALKFSPYKRKYEVLLCFCNSVQA
jgi:hypothetical protein